MGSRRKSQQVESSAPEEGRVTFKTGQSKVKQWNECKFSYHLKHVERLRPKKTKRPFTFGGLVHKMLEEHAMGRDPFDVIENVPVADRKLFAAEVEMYGNILEDLEYIMTDYFDFWKKADIKYVSLNGRKAEHAFAIEIEDGLVFQGKIDAVGMWRGHRSLVEHKTFKQRPDENFRWTNVQSSVYIRAMDILGWKSVDGTLWDYISSKPPSTPGILTSGKVSQANINTLPSKVRQFLSDNKFKTKDYPDLLAKAKANRENYFFRVFTPISKTIVDSMFNEFVESSRDMMENHGKRKTKNIGRHCSWCDFQDICRAELTGADSDFIKERNYVVEEKSHEDEVAEASNED